MCHLERPRLGSQSRRKRLYQAFRELGRVVRTVFLLEYLNDAPLREHITATTNKVEAYNARLREMVELRRRRCDRHA
jgi:TnpA family transposase